MKTPVEMFGEFLREAAVLLGVFIPLDVALATRRLTLPAGLYLVHRQRKDRDSHRRQ